MKFSTFTKILQQWVGIVAIVLAGVWTFALFGLERGFSYRATSSLSTSVIPLSKEYAILSINMSVENAGLRAIELQKQSVIVDLVSPVTAEFLPPESETSLARIAGDPLLLKFPNVCSMINDDLNIRVEAGETETISSEFLVPNAWSVMRIRVLLSDDKENKNWGWKDVGYQRGHVVDADMENPAGWTDVDLDHRLIRCTSV